MKSVKIGQVRRLKGLGFCLKDIAAITSLAVADVCYALRGGPRKRKTVGRRSVPYAWKQRIYARCGGRCVFCGQGDKRKLQYDHIIPVSRGGEHVESNIQLACWLCNTSKGNRTEPTWMKAAERRAERRKGKAL